MRVLALETSSTRGSAALIESSQIVATACHNFPNSHSDQLLPMLQNLFAETGWARNSIDRLAVGLGPGSFTGLRIGIALCEGIALGLDRPLVGVGSLQAMAASVPKQQYPGHRCALLDARRGECFIGVYSEDGQELLAPCAVLRTEVWEKLRGCGSERPAVAVGLPCQDLLTGLLPIHTGVYADLPHAHWVGLLGAQLELGVNYEPVYVHGIGAIQPHLPRSPFSEDSSH